MLGIQTTLKKGFFFTIAQKEQNLLKVKNGKLFIRNYIQLNQALWKMNINLKKTIN